MTELIPRPIDLDADRLAALERSEARLAAGQARSGISSRQRLRDSIARMRGQQRPDAADCTDVD